MTTSTSNQSRECNLGFATLPDQLLVRPTPIVGEHHWGFVLRAAYRNGLAKSKWLLDGGVKSKAYQTNEHIRVCGVCMAEPNAYWREEWCFGLPICSRHLCWLHDTCTGCHRRMTKRLSCLLACQCGTTYAAIPPSSLPDSILWLLGKRSSEKGDEWCLGLPVDRRWYLASLLGALWIHGLQGKPLKKASVRSVEAERRCVVAGSEILQAGRIGLFELLERIQTKPTAEIRTLLFQEAFPGLLRRLRRHLATEELTAISGFIRDYLKKETGSVLIVTRNKQFGATESIAACARRLDIRPDRVTTLLRDQGAGYAVRIAPSGRKMAAIRKTDLCALKKSKSDSLSRKDVQRLYGLSSGRQVELINAGLVRVLGRRIDRASVEALVSGLVARGSRLAAKDLDDFAPLSELLRTVVPVSQTIAFFTAISAGTICVVRKGKTACNYRVILASKHDTRHVLAQDRQSVQDFTIPAAAKHLGLKQEVMYHLVHQGIVSTQRRRIGRRAGACITMAELDRVTREIQPLARLAAVAGIDKRRAIHWAHERGLELVSGPQIDGGRQYFVKSNLDLFATPDSTLCSQFLP